MKKLIIGIIALFVLAGTVSSCGARDKCPSVHKSVAPAEKTV